MRHPTIGNTNEVGVALCIENVWNGMLYSPLMLASFIDFFDTGRLGVYFDVGYVLGYHQYPPHRIEVLGSRMQRVPIQGFRHEFDRDGTYSGCKHDEGDVCPAESIEALRSIGYDKAIVAQILPYEPELLEHSC